MDRGLWDIVEGTEAKPDPADDKLVESWIKRDRQALAQIVLTVASNLLVHVRSAKSSSEAWAKICSAFEAKGLASKVYLRRRFFTIKYQDGTGLSMQDHINKVRDLADQLAEMEAAVSDEDLAMTILCSMPDRFDSLIVSLESRPFKELTSDFVINRLLAEDRRQWEQGQQKLGMQEAHQVRAATSTRCSFCKIKGHIEAKCYRKHGYPVGHPLHSKASAAQVTSSGVPASNVINTSSMEYSAVSVCCLTSAAAWNRGRGEPMNWLIDSGASTHIGSQRSMFACLRPLDQPVHINIADGRVVRALAIGDIHIDVEYDSRWTPLLIRDVLFAPDLKMNLLSVSRLTADGYVVSFFDRHCQIVKHDQIIASIHKEASDLYRLSLRMNPPHETVGVSSVDRLPKLWHARLGHLHTKAMLQLSNKHMAEGVPRLDSKLDLGVCEGCALGKSHRAPMPRQATTRATRLLELVHSDICGPMPVHSLGGKRYFITFVDDYSRLMAVYTIANKSEAYSTFMTYKAWAENATGHRIKTLRTDGGGEYTSNQFIQVLAQYGIARQQTPPYTPEHNGVAERANRTLMEMARSMLYASGLDQSFWGEAVICAAYLRNRCPSSAIASDRTPFELWKGRKPRYEHLRVFGCQAYVHVPDAKRSKLDAKSTRCIFIGYAQESKAYRFYDLERKRVVISRDAIFDETSFISRAPDHRVEWEHSTDPSSIDVMVPGRLDDLDDDVPDAIHDVSAQPDQQEDLRQSSDDQDSPFLANGDADIQSNEDVPSSPSSPPQPVRRSTRQRVPPIPFWDVQASEQQRAGLLGQQALVAAGQQFIADEPAHFRQVAHRTDHQQWEQAMQSEYDSIQRTGTWTLVPLPRDRKAIGCRWVYKLKRKADGSIDRYKARLVAQGFSQKEGVDFNETFAPVAKFCSIRALLALAAHQDLEIHQMDVNTAFLNGDLDEDIYMRQPDGYVVAGKEHLVCKLNKSLYGLKQAGRSWYTKIDKVLLDLGFGHLHSDHCVYQRREADTVIYIALYVDDLLILSNSTERLDQFKHKLSTIFDMKDLGEAHYVLGIQIQRDRQARTLSIGQHEYIKQVLDRFGMLDSKPVATPLATGTQLLKSDCPTTDEQRQAMSSVPYQSAIGAIMYAMLGTRPDIAYAVTVLSQFSHNPGPTHWAAVKRLLRYLRGTMDFKITYAGLPDAQIDIHSFPVLSGYCDADWGSDLNDRRSITGYVFTLAGGAISWQSKKQPTVALSSVEAEYMASTQATKEALWWRTFFKELGSSMTTPSQLFSDSQGSMALAKNPEYHSRTKHIDIQHHFVREHIANHNVQFDFVGTEDMIADVLTKPLPRDAHSKFVHSMGLGSGVSRLSGSVANRSLQPFRF